MSNDQSTKRVNISVSQEAYRYLEQLADIGLHGTSATNVASRLVTDSILQLVREGIIQIDQDSSGQ